MQSGMTFNLQRYSTHDGPGIRTVVFLKGCSLGCHWCQNPESRRRLPDLLFDSRLCLSGCQLCQAAGMHFTTEAEGSRCLQRTGLDSTKLDALRSLCPSAALSVVGAEQTIPELLASIRRDLPFYQRSGGGVTLSGGEPFMQPLFTAALLQAVKAESISTAVESCLHVPWRYIEPALPFIDLLLADLKHLDAEPFLHWTGGRAEQVQANFRRLKGGEVPLIIRIPLIPGFNADLTTVCRLFDFIVEQTSAREVHLLPYHTLGRHKYRLLGETYQAPEQPLHDDALLSLALQEAQTRGLHAVLRGQA